MRGVRGVGGPKASPSYPVGSECGDLRPPKRFVCLTKCLFPRNTDILEEVMVVAFGDLIKRATLARALHPTLDGRAQQDDQPFDLCVSIAWPPDFWTDARCAHGQNRHDRHGRAPNCGRDRGLAEQSRINRTGRPPRPKHRFSGLTKFYS